MTDTNNAKLEHHLPGSERPPARTQRLRTSGIFTFSRAERTVIDARYGATHKLGRSLHMGFLRLSGRSLNAVRVVPVSLWAHLGKELGVRSPELAFLKALYGRRSTLFEHQQLAEHTLGFRGITKHQNRAFVQVLRNSNSIPRSLLHWICLRRKPVRSSPPPSHGEFVLA